MLLIKPVVLTLIYLAPLTLQQDQGAAVYDDYYYYEDELPSRQPLPAKPAPKVKARATADTVAPTDSLAEEVPDYDIGELVTAWKAYIREKAEKEKADQVEEDYYVDDPQPPPRRARPRQPPPRRRRPERPRPRPRQRPRPQKEDYDDYYYDETPRRPAVEKPLRSQTERPEKPLRSQTERPGRPRRPTRPRDDYDDYYFDEPPRRRPRPSFFAEEENYECPPRSESYRREDPSQCDKYYECNIKGEEKELLCIDGLVYEPAQQGCDYPSKVVCGNRTKLQPAQPTKNCPRANGYFPWPAEESCQKFYDCRGGTAYLQKCAEGVIFDDMIDACTTPDQAIREDCKADKFLNFNCPQFSAEEVLRFGNHDRLPDPEDCKKFFTCLRGGQPRLGVCPKKTVFNYNTGQCDDPAKVPGCETYWTDQEEEELQDYYDYS